MTDSQDCITEDLLQGIEDGSLSPASLASVEQHVDECDQCKCMLDALSESKNWQEEILPTLQGLTWEADSFAEDTIGSTELNEIQALLGPTDDPNMLGRIGTYEVSGIIGSGGMGVVFKAFDPALDRFVAIKMLSPHLAASGAARRRFTREGKAAAAVVDDHVLPVYQVDQWRGIPFLVMQYSRGLTLQQRLNADGPLATEEVLRIGLQIAKGLAAAHSQGLVHRDVKPSNILLSDNVERAMLADFGLARAVDDASMTRTGVLAGTPQYMSPEQARGEAVDQSSDLFSLGSVMYAMCTARAPFRAENSLGVMRLISEQEPKPIRSINTEIPEWLAEVVRQLISKSPDDRPASANEVATCLKTCLAHIQQPASTPLPDAFRTRELPQNQPRQHWPLLATIGFTLALFIAGIFIVLEYGKGTIKISSEVANIPIRIMQGDKTVKELTVSQEPSSFKISAGKYRVFIDGKFDDVLVRDDKISLLRGGTATVTIERKPAKPKTGLGDEQIIASDTTLNVDDSLADFDRQSQANPQKQPPAGPANDLEGATFVSRTGVWELENSVILEISNGKDEQWGDIKRATLKWPAQNDLPALEYTVDISGDEHMQWAAAWKEGETTLWLLAQGQFQSGSSIRSIDYGTPANIVTCVGYGDDHFDLRLPELDDYRQSRRHAYSIGSPWTRMPKPLDRALVKHFNLREARYGISSLLPTGPYMAGGQYSEPAWTTKGWIFEGKVLDKLGKPMSNTAIAARFRHQPSVEIAKAVTDAEGKFEFVLTCDICTLASNRAIELVCEAIDTQVVFELWLTEDEQFESLSTAVENSIRSVNSPLPRSYGFRVTGKGKLFWPPKPAEGEPQALPSQTTRVEFRPETLSEDESQDDTTGLEDQVEQIRRGLVSVTVDCEQGSSSGMGWLVTPDQIVMPSFPAWLLDIEHADFDVNIRLHSGDVIQRATHQMLGSISLLTLDTPVEKATTVSLDAEPRINNKNTVFAIGDNEKHKGTIESSGKSISFRGNSNFSLSPPFKFHNAMAIELEENSDLQCGSPIINSSGEIVGMLMVFGEHTIAVSVEEVRALCDQLLGSSLRKMATTPNLSETESSTFDSISLKWQQVEKQIGLRLGKSESAKEPYERGIGIIEVVADSIAEKAGFREGDVLVGMGEWRTENKGDLNWILKHFLDGDDNADAQSKNVRTKQSVSFHVFRDDDIFWGKLELPIGKEKK